MIINRKQNAKRNIITGTIFKLYQIIIPFFMRTLMIYQMGMEYAGLNNLFTSIFQMLNLAELGIGAALTVSMYKPIAEDNRKEICALLNAYKKYFSIIGWIVFTLGLLCIPFLRFLVKGSIPGNLNMTVLYLMYLINTVLSYWLFSYRKSLIYAHQRNDVINVSMLITFTFQFVMQAYVLIFLKNYYLYLLASILGQIVLNLMCAVVSQKMYPDYTPVGELEKETIDDIIKKVKGLVTNKVGGTILRSSDSIIISSFLGLSVLAIYQNYYFIISAIMSIFAIIYESCIAGIGNSLIVESQEKNYIDFCDITTIIGWFLAISCACFITLFQPFMIIWVGSDNLMSISFVIFMIVHFFLYEIDQLIGLYKDAAGIWYADRFRPLITAMINIVLNIILVNWFGLYGVLAATIVSVLLVDLPWLLYNVFQNIFKFESAGKYVWKLISLCVIAFVASYLSYFACSYVN
ncbi:TPA: oligosaccharide flippase family protein, partial [Enterococcus faecium]|nr:oligosaccharide flippase family protein [Enterococcus faecium]